MVLYILNTIVATGLALLCYQLFLKREKIFIFNRFYLLLSLMACLIAPVLSLETETAITLTDVSRVLSIESSVAIVDHYETSIVEEMNSSSFNFWHFVITVYALISMLFVFRFSRNLYSIFMLTQSVGQIEGRLKIVELQDTSNSFSFFNYMFISQHILRDPEKKQLVLRHEMTHCLQRHSIDIIFVELIKCFFWFNPFVWLYKRAIAENHEFLADEAVINNGVDVMRYSQSLIKTKKDIQLYSMSSGFNIVQTKNRLKMLHQSKSTVIRQLIRTITTLAIFACVFMVSISAAYKKPILVVIDAGHGGKDLGHLNEKEVNLNIAKLLETKSNARITIKLIRKTDEFLSLKQRAEYVNKLKPDLFLSLHCNASTNTSKSGVEALYFEEGNHKKASYHFSKHLITEQLEIATQKGRISSTSGIYLLKHVQCPAVLLELGYLTNETDNLRLTNQEGQVQAANAIYEALERGQD